jgi:hypothetical protein
VNRDEDQPNFEFSLFGGFVTTAQVREKVDYDVFVPDDSDDLYLGLTVRVTLHVSGRFIALSFQMCACIEIQLVLG